MGQGGPWQALATAVAAVAALALAAPAPAQAPPPAGGAVRVLSVGDVPSLDPGLVSGALGAQVSTAVSRQLYTFFPGDADTASPDLALDPPEVSDDQRSVTVRLRSGVHYAPPVGREVVAADVKYALERAFSTHVPNPEVFSLLGDIAGAPRRPTARIRPIAGIQAPDATTLVLQLRKPVAGEVAAALALPVTAPVPPEYARRFDRARISTYGAHVVATGPYTARRKPGRAIYLARNPSWDPAGDLRPAHLDSIVVDERPTDVASAARRTLNGARTLAGADVQPGAKQVANARDTRPGQIRQVAGGSTRWIALNTRVGPLRNANVRRAVAAGIDRGALARAYGGRTVAQVATHFIPPGAPGYAEAGGGAGARADFLATPEANRRLARHYLRLAGFESGRYTGRARLTLVGVASGPGRRVADSVARQLQLLGFHLRVRRLPTAAMRARCSRPAARVAICPTAGASRTTADPAPLLRPAFDGSRIRARDNRNWPALDDRAINRAMGAAAALPAGPDRLAAWGAIDRSIVRTAAAVPYMWVRAAMLQSADADGAVNEFTGAWDLSFSRLRG